MKKEVSAFKEAFKALQPFDELKHEIVRLEELYRSEKEKSVNSEKKVAELRKEILKVKKEKHAVSSDMKTLKSLVHDQETKINQLEEKVKSTEKALKAKDDIINIKTAEADDQRNKVGEFKNEIQILSEKLSEVTRMKLVEDEFHLSSKVCGLKAEKFEDKKQHIRVEHCKSKASQSEIKENKLFDYPCFCCDEMVN